MVAAQSGPFLVIGGGGFLGGHIIRALLDRGDSVSAFDLVQKDIDPRVKFFCGDLTNSMSLGDAIEKVGTFIHDHVDLSLHTSLLERRHLHHTHRVTET